MSGEQFAETAALLAYMEDDHDKLSELLEDMLPGELAALALTLDGLRGQVLEVRYRRRREAAALDAEAALRDRQEGAQR
jgi:hypothetical protein